MAKTSAPMGMEQNLSRKLLPLSVGIALLIAVLAPVTFWIHEHQNCQYLANLYAEDLAGKLQRFAQESPLLWKYQTYKFIAITEGFHPAVDVRGFRVLDEKGAPISGYEYKNGGETYGRELTFGEELDYTLGTAPLLFNNRRVGSIEVLVDDARLVRATALLFCFTSLGGIALAVLVYRLPVRVVRKMEGEIDALIANLRRSEERYRSLVTNIPDVMWTSDSNGKTAFISPNLERVTGFPVSEAYESEAFWFGGIHPDDVESVKRAYEELIARNTMFDIDYRFRKKDGTWLWLRDRAVASYEKDGVVYVDGMFTDITERRCAEEEIRRLNAELELKVEERTRELVEAQEELVRKEKLSILGQLSGSVGHELRNPLGVMSNAVYFLQMVLTEADETTKEYLGIIKKEIDNSQRIITDLLDFARTRTPQTKTVPARELIDESLGKCVIPENVGLQIDMPDTLPLLKIDPLQMGQVFQNLIANAVQAMPDGGALSVAARRMRSAECGMRNEDKGSELDGDIIEISVSDTGIGISPENMKKLFQPLFTTRAKGIGLGLVVCKNLVEANGGRIGVESRVGEGTTFMVSLPLAEG